MSRAETLLEPGRGDDALRWYQHIAGLAAWRAVYQHSSCTGQTLRMIGA